MREAIERVIKYLEDQRELEADDFNYPVAQAFEIAANKLKEVIASEDEKQRFADSIQNAPPYRKVEVRSAENNN